MANTTQYAQLNIGRGVGNDGVTMAADVWERFVGACGDALAYAARDLAAGVTRTEMAGRVEVHHGSGVWQGVREDSAHVSLFNEHGISIAALRESVADLAHDYGQDAVALIVGSELIEA